MRGFLTALMLPTAGRGSAPPTGQPPALLTLKTTIRARDFDASRRFYAEFLGLRVVQEWNEGDDRGCIFAFGGSRATGFLEVSAASLDPRSRAAHALAANDKVELQLKTDSLDAWVVELRRRGIESEGPVSRPWGNRYLWLRDPDGVPIALFEGSV